MVPYKKKRVWLVLMIHKSCGHLHNFYENVFEVVFCNVIAVVQKKGAREGLAAVIYMTDVISRGGGLLYWVLPKSSLLQCSPAMGHINTKQGKEIQQSSSLREGGKELPNPRTS